MGAGKMLIQEYLREIVSSSYLFPRSRTALLSEDEETLLLSEYFLIEIIPLPLLRRLLEILELVECSLLQLR